MKHPRAIIFSELVLALLSCTLMSCKPIISFLLPERISEGEAALGSIVGKVTLPSGTGISPKDLTITTGLNGTITVDSTGTYQAKINPQAPVLAVAKTPSNSLIFMSIFTAASGSNDLNASTTAVSMVFISLGLYTTDSSTWPAIETAIAGVQEVQGLAATLAAKLSANPDTLSEDPPDQDILSSLNAAVLASATTAAKSLKSNSRDISITPAIAQSGLALNVNSQNELIATNAKRRYVMVTVKNESSGISADTLVGPSTPPVLFYLPTKTTLMPDPLPSPPPGLSNTFTIRACGGTSNANNCYDSTLDENKLRVALMYSGVVEFIIPLFNLLLGAPISNVSNAAINEIITVFATPFTVFAQNIIDGIPSNNSNIGTSVLRLVKLTLSAFASDWPKVAVIATTYLGTQGTTQAIQTALANNPTIGILVRIIALLTNGSEMWFAYDDLRTTDMVNTYSIKVTSQGLITVAAPTISPASGIYAVSQNLSIVTTTPGASIRYTVDGSTPTISLGVLYSGPIAISSTTTIKAMAYKQGCTDSSISSATLVFPGSTWTAHALPDYQGWSAVAYGNGTFVAISCASNYNASPSSSIVAATSVDGSNWTKRTLSSSQSWSAIAFGNGLFVAISNSFAAISPDGISWTQHALPNTLSWSSITFGNGIFVAISKEGYVTRWNGQTWYYSINRPLPAGGLEWDSIAFGNGQFVAVGIGDNIATSNDGDTWTKQFVPPGGYYWHSIWYGGGRFVAVPNGLANNYAASSLDAINWTLGTLPNSSGWGGITYGDGIFVVVSSGWLSSLAATSPDGVTWTPRFLPSNQIWSSVVYGNGTFAAVSSTTFTSNVSATSP